MSAIVGCFSSLSDGSDGLLPDLGVIVVVVVVGGNEGGGLLVGLGGSVNVIPARAATLPKEGLDPLALFSLSLFKNESA